MKKLLLVLLAVVMVFSIFACSKKEGNTPADTTKPGVTTGGDVTNPGTTLPVTTTKDLTKPDVPDMTFDGVEYRVATRENNLKVEVFADETAVDIRQTALQQRNATVEDAYDVIITPFVSTDNSLRGQTTELMNLVYAEEDVYDISLTYAAATGSFVAGGYVINWNNLKYNDFSKYYWMNDINKNLVIDDAIYTVVGDMCISTITNTYGMFYNRTEGDKITMDSGDTMTEEVFQKIEDMEWTMDYFIDLVGDIYQDIDDTTGVSDDDFYGFTAEALTNLDIWQFAFDIPMIVHDETDGLKCVFNTEKTAVMVDKLNTLYWENNGSLILNGCTQKFVNGNVVFHTTWLERCFGTFKDMEEQYTILPYPMYDENQENYMAGAMDNYNIICIPFTCTELEMVSYITEVLNYESREQLYPVYYEESLQKQYTRDPESIEMLDIIMDGRNFDLGTLFPTNTNGVALMVRGAVAAKNNDFTTYYAEREEGVITALKNLVEQYELNKRVGEE